MTTFKVKAINEIDLYRIGQQAQGQSAIWIEVQGQEYGILMLADEFLDSLTYHAGVKIGSEFLSPLWGLVNLIYDDASDLTCGVFDDLTCKAEGAAADYRAMLIPAAAFEQVKEQLAKVRDPKLTIKVELL